jgi:hypothetical protein
MLTNLAHFEQVLDKIIEQRIDILRDNLEINSYEDLAQFKYVMGQIAGLRLVKSELIPEAKELADQRNR